MTGCQREGELPVNATSVAKPVRRRRRFRYVLLVICLLSAGILFAAEASLRLVARANADYAIRIGALLEWDPELRIRLRKDMSFGDATLNSKGFLGPEFDTRKAPGSVRIVTLGDSCSFIPTDHPYPRFLEDSLSAAFAPGKVEVINASCPGYHSGQARTWYENEIDGYEHDILVIFLGWNDMGHFNPDAKPYAWPPDVSAETPSLWQRTISQCYLLRSFQYFSTYRRQGELVSFEPFAGSAARQYYRSAVPDHYMDNMRAIIELAERRGRRVFVLNRPTLVCDQPTEDEQRRMHFPVGMGRRLAKFLLLIHAYDSALEKVARDKNVPIIDLKSLFATEAERRSFTDSSHFDVVAAERIGARVADALRPQCETILNGR